MRDPCCGPPRASGPPEPALPARADSFPEPGRPRSVGGPVAAAGRPTGALGQLPPPRPRARNSLLLLLKNPSEHVYIEPHKLPARAFTIPGESEPALGKWGHQGCGGQIIGFSVCGWGGAGGESTGLRVGSDPSVANVRLSGSW